MCSLAHVSDAEIVDEDVFVDVILRMWDQGSGRPMCAKRAAALATERMPRGPCAFRRSTCNPRTCLAWPPRSPCNRAPSFPSPAAARHRAASSHPWASLLSLPFCSPEFTGKHAYEGEEKDFEQAYFFTPPHPDHW